MKKLFVFFSVVVLTASLLSFSVKAQYLMLHSFTGQPDGSYPESGLFFDGTYLYGMSYQGGLYDMGSLFKVMPDGSNYSTILNFDGTTNGGYPTGAVVSDGTYLYGMTQQGGSHLMGTIFKIKPDGTGFSKLLDFTGTANGRYPQGSLVIDGSYLFGMAFRGGVNDSGTVFKIMNDGSAFTKLLDFDGSSTGGWPYGSLYYDGSFLYGMTYLGGAQDIGVLFKIMTDGSGFLKLMDFTGLTNGSYPTGDLTSDGTYLYGMTQQGGLNDKGTIFKTLPDGSGYLKLLDFSVVNGSYPYTGALVSEGNYLYGMTEEGGANNMGTVFKIMNDGSGYQLLVDFSGASNGSYPYSSLVSDGNFLYGMTEQGGTQGIGTLFKFQHVVTGLEDADAENDFVIYPNPGSDWITLIRLPETHTGPLSPGKNIISIYSLLGEKLLEMSLDGKEKETMLNVSTLGSGVYMLKIVAGEKVHTEKIVVSRDGFAE